MLNKVCVKNHVSKVEKEKKLKNYAKRDLWLILLQHNKRFSRVENVNKNQSREHKKQQKFLFAEQLLFISSYNVKLEIIIRVKNNEIVCVH